MAGLWISAATIENSMEAPQKTEKKTTAWLSNFTPGYVDKENENTNSKRHMQKKKKRHMHSKVQSSIIYNRRDRDAT